METREGNPDRDRVAAADRLLRSLSNLRDDGVERRHEEVIEWAEQEGMTRDYAEQVYALAEEEGLEPVYAVHLVRAGLGVRELQPPEQDMEEAVQQAPPEWVAEDVVELDDVALERRLRATFRRFRAHLEEAGDARAAAQRFVADADVDAEPLR